MGVVLVLGRFVVVGWLLFRHGLMGFVFFPFGGLDLVLIFVVNVGRGMGWEMRGEGFS